MELTGGRADFLDEPAFDREMNIFVRDVEAEAATADLAFDSFQSRNDFAHLGSGQETHARKHPRMCDRAANIVAIEPAIEGERGAERLDLGQSRALETSADEILRRTNAWRRPPGRFGRPAPTVITTLLHSGRGAGKNGALLGTKPVFTRGEAQAESSRFFEQHPTSASAASCRSNFVRHRSARRWDGGRERQSRDHTWRIRTSVRAVPVSAQAAAV